LVKFPSIDCNSILNTSGTTIDINIRHNFPVKLSTSYVVGGDVKINGTLISSYDSINFSGTIFFRLNMECSRCLDNNLNDLSIPLDCLFTENNEDDSLSILRDKVINLEGIIVDAIIGSIEMKYLCFDKCKGLCVICGNNLNISDCGHEYKENKKNIKENPFSLLNELDLKVE
tara:strand:+ start:34 stop:552 length:519 start_codon:yes stop_codon:yes gene_type:complete